MLIISHYDRMRLAKYIFFCKFKKMATQDKNLNPYVGIQNLIF